MRWWSLVVLGACVLSPTASWAYGEGEDIPWASRVIHLLTNEARCDIGEALSECGAHCDAEWSCYGLSLPPVYWDDELYRAAQFHATMVSATEGASWGCMQHDSPCTLKSTVAQDFPAVCDGRPACACEEGAAVCGQKGTSFGDRIGMFASGMTGMGENIAVASTPLATFESWIFEDGELTGCEFSSANGHRRNILNSGYDSLGVGWIEGKQSVQDFKSGGDHHEIITSGSHYVDGDGVLWFKFHTYVGKAEIDEPTLRPIIGKATLSFGGECHSMEPIRLVDSSFSNVVWGVSDVGSSKTCVPYFFEGIDDDGRVTRYPTTGYLLYQCDKAWSAEGQTESCIKSASCTQAEKCASALPLYCQQGRWEYAYEQFCKEKSDGTWSMEAFSNCDCQISRKPASLSWWMCLIVLPVGIALRARRLGRREG